LGIKSDQKLIWKNHKEMITAKARYTHKPKYWQILNKDNQQPL